MRVAVFDTYIVMKNEAARHFEIIVPVDQSHEKVIQYGREYLKRAGQDELPLTTKECIFWHTEAASDNIKKAIKEQGYCIYEIEESN
ncbi:MAG: DUF2024 family protein [Candidatus Scalindua sp.]|nr:DUF2024 family protein [Candidatus Scalindua sp.]